MSSPQPPTPAPNLSPTQAIPLLPGTTAPRLGALTSEKSRGTELVSFRIPLFMKAAAAKAVHDPRFNFGGTMSHLYLQAVGAYLLSLEPFFQGDREFDEWAQHVREADAILALQEPIEQFREMLDRAEDKAEAATARKSLDYGFELLKGAVQFACYPKDETLREAISAMLRSSKPMQALTRALLDDEGYGMSDEVDRLQKFMGGAL